MFEIFSGPARQAILLAQDEAIGLGHDFVGTGHLLLGLLAGGGNAAARTLGSVGLASDTGRPLVLTRTAERRE